MKRCIKTASGFGGCNAAVSLALEPYAKRSLPLSPAPFAVRNRCVIAEGRIHVNDSVAFEQQTSLFPDFIRAAYKQLSLDDRKFYKMDDLCKLGYIATAYLMSAEEKTENYDPEEVALVFANSSSSLDSDVLHQSIINESANNGEASPAVFVYTLPNVVMGELCILYGIKGEIKFFVQKSYNVEVLMDYAALILNSSKLKACLVGWSELLGGKYEARFSWLEKIN